MSPGTKRSLPALYVPEKVEVMLVRHPGIRIPQILQIETFT